MVLALQKDKKQVIEDWISKFNNLVKCIKIHQFKYGPRVEYLDLIIFKGNRFHDQGVFEIKIFQKELCV